MTTHRSDPSALRMYGSADPEADTEILPLSDVLAVRARLEARKAEQASWDAWRRSCARKRAAKVVGEVVALAWLINVLGWLS
jgi:hypothetical protein